MKVISSNNAKDYILKKFDQIKILSHYLDIPDRDITYCLHRTTNRISNPLRIDEDPSLGFRFYDTHSGTKLITTDFGNSYYSGDIFDMVGIVLGKNPYNPKDFIYIIKDILRTENDKSSYRMTIDRSYESKLIDNHIIKIDIEPRSFNFDDYKYWIDHGITPEYIKLGNIIPVNRYWKDDYINKYIYSKDDPCYCYYLGTKEEIDIVKLYFPRRSKKAHRFDTNCTTYIEAVHELTDKTNVLISKARKDKLLILRIVHDLNLDLCITNASSERIIPIKVVKVLNNIYENVYSLFDYDETGITTMKEMYRLHNIIHPSFPPVISKKLETSKDLSGYCLKEGYNKTKELFIDIYNNLKHITNEEY